MVSIVIYDDHKERREALELLIGMQTDMICYGSYKNCLSIKEDLKEKIPDVALMDIDMPGINGIEAVKIIRTFFPDVLIIMQTVFDDDDKIFKSISAGANGYFLKKTPPEKLIEGIYDVVNGGAPMTASIAAKVLQYFRSHSSQTAAPDYNLSERETEILRLIVKGFSQKMIGAELNISKFTVNNHLKKIYTKLQVHNASEAVAIALNKNIIQHRK